MDYLNLPNPYQRLTIPDQIWVGHLFTLLNIALTILLWRTLRHRIDTELSRAGRSATPNRTGG